jgi:DHA2 family multidrug resistance protein
MITKQALFIAYLDDFKLMMIVSFAILPLLFFMKRGNKVGTGGSAMAMD